MLPDKNEQFDWRSLWADLLQGVGAGLLHNDGSRMAQAALAGLDAFDLARERRERRSAGRTDPGEPPSRGPFALPWSNMSAAELAAFSRQSPELQQAFREEWAGIGSEDDLTAQDQPEIEEYRPAAPFPTRREPLSSNPLESWWRSRNLPFGPDGRLTWPSRRS